MFSLDEEKNSEKNKRVQDRQSNDSGLKHHPSKLDFRLRSERTCQNICLSKPNIRFQTNGMLV